MHPKSEHGSHVRTFCTHGDSRMINARANICAGRSHVKVARSDSVLHRVKAVLQCTCCARRANPQHTEPCARIAFVLHLSLLFRWSVGRVPRSLARLVTGCLAAAPDTRQLNASCEAKYWFSRACTGCSVPSNGAPCHQSAAYS